MKITAQKITPAKIELYKDEADIIIDFKLLCERISRGMKDTNTTEVKAATFDGTVTVTQVGIDNMLMMANQLFQVINILPEV